jgi:putative tricarboxylic transport membrane protein
LSLTNISGAGLLIGLGILLTAGIIGYDGLTMRVPPVHAKVGPNIFPLLVACGLAISGALILWRARAGDFPYSEGETDWRGLGLVAAGLVLHLNLLKPLGFIPAGVILFTMVAAGFGSRNFLRDLIVAIVMVSICYFGFTRGLGLQLPGGVLAGII